MKIYFEFRDIIRTKTKDEIYWLLHTLFNRFKKNFSIASCTLEYLLAYKKNNFRFIFLETIKLRNDFSRDMLFLSFLKINPSYIKLWLQLFLDNFTFERRINLLQSALFFFPISKILLNLAKLIIGIETMVSSKNCINLKNFYFKYNNNFELENSFKNKKVLPIFLKTLNSNSINFFPLRFIYKSGCLNSFSFFHSQELFLLSKNNKKSNLIFCKNLIYLLEFNEINFRIFFNFKSFKIKSESDRGIFFHLNLSNCESLIKSLFFTTGKIKNHRIVEYRIYHLILKGSKIFFGGYSKYRNTQKILKKDCCTEFFKRKSNLELYLYFIQIKFIKSLKKINFETFNLPGSLTLLQIYPPRPNIGLTEKNRKSQYHNQMHLDRFLFFLVQVNFRCNNID